MARNFEAIISVLDKASAPILALEKRIAHLGHTGAATQHSLTMSPHERLWDHLVEHVTGAHEAFHGLGEKAGEAGSRIGEVLPMLGALGAAGSAAGLVELVHHTAEAAEAVQNLAIIVGTSVPQMQKLQYAAKQVGMDGQQVGDGLGRLNQRIGNAARGQDKQSAQLFHAMGINLKDANGHLRDAATILPEVEKSFAATKDPALRVAMAMQLFGRTGRDMMPFLTMGPEKLKEMSDRFDSFGHGFKPEELEDLEKFNSAWKNLEASIDGTASVISAALAPALTPLLEDFAKWVALNRDWVAQDIRDVLEGIGDTLKEIDFHSVVDDIREFAHKTHDVIESIGGLKYALIGAGGIMAASFAAPLLTMTATLVEFGVSAGITAVSSLVGLGASMVSVIPQITKLRDVWAAMDLVMDANPIGVVVLAVAALGAAGYELWKNWDWVSKQLGSVWDWLGEKFNAVFGPIERGMNFVSHTLGFDTNPGMAAAAAGGGMAPGMQPPLAPLYGAGGAAEPTASSARPAHAQVDIRIVSDRDNVVAGVQSRDMPPPRVQLGSTGMLGGMGGLGAFALP